MFKWHYAGELMVFSLVLMWFVRCLYLVLFTKRIFLEMFESIFLRTKGYSLDKRMIAIFYNKQMHVSFSQTRSNVLKIAWECSFRASRGVKFPKFLEVTPNHGGCSLTAFRISQNTFYIYFEPWFRIISS